MSPRVSTSTTPQIESSAPRIWRPLMAVPQKMRPSPSIQMGMLALTRVTLSGLEVFSDRYSRLL